MRLHLIGVSALVTAMEAETLLRHHQDDHAASDATPPSRYLDDTLTDWLSHPEAP